MSTEPRELIGNTLGRHFLEKATRMGYGARVEWWVCLDCGWASEEFDLDDSEVRGEIERIKRGHQADAVLAALQTGGRLRGEEQFVIEYDYRSDNGPRLVGPFPSRDAAQDYADSLRGPGWEATFCICPLAAAAEREANR